MAHGSYPNRILTLQIEEEPILATTQTKTFQRRLEPLYIADSIEQVAIEAVKNLQGRLSINDAEIGWLVARSSPPLA